MPNKNSLIFCILLFFLQTLAFGVLSEFTHFDRHNLLDARAGGMGGAYIGLSDTLIGGYYNPAGLAYIDYKRTTESNNIFRNSTLTYTSVSDNFSYEFKTETTSPPFIGLFQNYGGFNLLFSVIIPKSETYNKDYNKTFNNGGVNITFYENFDGHNNHYLIGPSVAAMLSDNFSIGVSAFYSYESRNYIQNIYTFPTDFQSSLQIWDNTYNEENTHEMLGIFGMQWMPSLDLSFGMKVNYPYQISSKGTEQQTKATLDHTNNQYSSTIASSTYDLKNLGFQSNYPMVGLGGAYILSSSTLFAFDLTYMISSKASQQFPTKSTMNFALGGEHYLLTFVPIRFGIYSNNSYYPDNSNGDHLNGFGLTGSIGYESGANSLSVAVDYQFASGTTTNNGTTTDNLQYSGLTVLLSGSSSI